MTITYHQAAWQKTPGQPLQIGPVALPEPEANEILIRNAAIAINPIDWLLQDAPILPWLTYPAILGSDVAGQVVAVGNQVNRFKPGDRVIGQAVGTTVDQPAQGAFQQHTIVLEHMAAPIPDALTFADAAVIPLGLGTAAVGLYGTAHLNLAPPTRSFAVNDDVVLIWGGSSSVGCNAIQLAVASGYTCIATASERNAELLKRLGASIVIDYSSDDVVAKIVDAMRGRRLAGTLHATGDMEACFAVVSQSDGVHRVAMTLTPPDQRPVGIVATHIAGTSLKDDGIGPLIYRDFLPRALASGSFIAAPPARIAGHGLHALQSAVETQKAGISGEKIVVTLA